MTTTTLDRVQGHAPGHTGIFESVVGWFKFNTAVRRTTRELSKLSDRELNDLGIGRWDIPRIAREAASGRGR